MNRRQFLKAGLVFSSALVAANCGGEENTAPIPPPNPAPVLPRVNYITQDPAFTDYRPAVDVTGQRAIFERTSVDPSGLTKIFLAENIFSSVDVRPFLPADAPNSQTRPDWSWATGRVAFNGAESNAGVVQVHLCNSQGLELSQVANSMGYLYPIWIADGSQLIVFNNSQAASPIPSSSQIQLDGTVVFANMNGADANGVPMFAGFASPNPLDPTRLAVAGQPTLSTWVPGVTEQCPNEPSGYNQCFNYVFLSSLQNGVFSSAPLEAGAPITAFDPRFQGRAPYWSPDGRYLVFESDRLGGYALFLADTVAGTPPVQLTDPALQAQHGKFFPGGTRIIFTCLQSAGASARGIAWIDIAEFLA